MTNITLTDGTRTVTLYVNSPPEYKPHIKKKEFVIPGRKDVICQYFNTANKEIILAGKMARSQSSIAYMGLVDYWMKNGIGIDTGQLYYNDNLNTNYRVFINTGDFSYRFVPGQSNTQLIEYDLKLTEFQWTAT